MTRAASAALLPLDAARDRLIEGLAPVAPTLLPLASAVGRVLAGEIRVETDLPAVRTALRDGWAIDAAQVAGASPYGPVPLPRAPDWVEAGDALPARTDAVLPPEAIEGRDAVGDAAPCEGVSEAGAELRAGETLVAAGARLTPLHLLALAAAGLATVPVRLPRLRLVATGSPRPAPADALGPLLSALIATAGGLVADGLHAPDDPEAIAEAIRAPGADAVLVLGGTGFGRNDRSAEALARAGTLQAHGLALRPGENAGFGAAEGRPVLLLPGRPEAALAVFLVLGLPLLDALAGAQVQPPTGAKLLRKVASTIGLSEIVYLRRLPDGVAPLGGADLPLARLMRADAALLVPPEREGYPEGAHVGIMTL